MIICVNLYKGAIRMVDDKKTRVGTGLLLTPGNLG